MAVKINVCHCISCQRGYPIDRFYKTKSNTTFLPEGVIPYCENCCEDIFNYYLSKTQDVQEAYRFTCAKVDIPFIQKVYDTVSQYNEKLMKNKRNKENPNEHMFKNYYMFLWGEKSIESDIDKWNDYSDSDIPYTAIVKSDSNDSENDDYIRFELDWGKQSYEDYQFLEYRWNFWTSDSPINKAQETLYRQLCLVELRKRKKESVSDGQLGESTKEEQEMILRLMKELKINNFEEKKDKSLVEMMIESQIAEIEQTDPCETVDKEYYKDYCDIEKSWGKQILRALKNLLVGSNEFPDINREPNEW